MISEFFLVWVAVLALLLMNLTPLWLSYAHDRRYGLWQKQRSVLAWFTRVLAVEAVAATAFTMVIFITVHA